MVIIGLLVGYVAPNYISVVGKSEVKAARAQIDTLRKVLVAYRLDVGTYPGSDPGLSALVQKLAGASQWTGPFPSKAVPVDPWGHPYVYRFPDAAFWRIRRYYTASPAEPESNTGCQAAPGPIVLAGSAFAKRGGPTFDKRSLASSLPQLPAVTPKLFMHPKPPLTLPIS